MRKKCMALFLAALLIGSFAACKSSGGVKVPASQIGGTDFQKNMHQADFYLLNRMCETDSGIYFDCERLYYLDKETNRAVVVCGKPDCTHTDQTCNARLRPNYLWFNGSRLYYISDAYEKEGGRSVDRGNRVFSVNPDCTDRREVQQLDFEIGGDSTFIVNNPIFHRGMVYFEYNDVLYSVPLGAGLEEAKAIWGTETDGGNGGSMVFFDGNSPQYELWADGDLVYFMVETEQPDGGYRKTLFACGQNSKEARQVWVAPTVDVIGEWEAWDELITGQATAMSQWYVKDGSIYLFYSKNGMWRCSLETGEYEKLADTTKQAEYGSAIFSDCNMILLNDGPEPDAYLGRTVEGMGHTGGDTLFVYGMDGALTKTLPLTAVTDAIEGVTGYHLLAQSGEHLYFLAEAKVMGDLKDGVSSMVSQRLTLFGLDIETGEFTQICDLKSE